MDLSTHSAGDLTNDDFALAGKIQNIYGQESVWRSTSHYRQTEKEARRYQ